MQDNLKYAELHLGILQNRQTKLKQQMNVCAAKLDMKNKNIDKKEEREKFERLNVEYTKIEEEICDYEEKVLEITKL